MIIPGLLWLKFENCFIIDVISEQQSIKNLSLDGRRAISRSEEQQMGEA